MGKLHETGKPPPFLDSSSKLQFDSCTTHASCPVLRMCCTVFVYNCTVLFSQWVRFRVGGAQSDIVLCLHHPARHCPGPKWRIRVLTKWPCEFCDTHAVMILIFGHCRRAHHSQYLANNISRGLSSTWKNILICSTPRCCCNNISSSASKNPCLM